MFLRIYIVLVLLGGQMVFGQQQQVDSGWIERKFSMLVHWGLYSELGGVWNGDTIRSGRSECIQAFAAISKEQYEAVAKRFNPERWNPEAVVRVAVAAGMRSVVFTAKHKDGFCMYHSGQTDYNVVEATPFKRDVLRELADACRQNGLKFGLYFSLEDWHFTGMIMEKGGMSPMTSEQHVYNLRQVEELLTRYGEVSEIWFDGGGLTEQQRHELYRLVKRVQPQCMVGGRMESNQGDFYVMTSDPMPNYRIGVPWQMARPFFEGTWGYRSWQAGGKVEQEVKKKLNELIRVVSRGGNYLLNVGLDGAGALGEFEQQVLGQMGYWLRRHRSAIYETEANPFRYARSWGEMTCKGNKLYLFIRRVPSSREIYLRGVRGEARRAVLKGALQYPLRLEQSEDMLMLYIPETVYPERGIIVAEIEFTGAFRIVLEEWVREKLLTAGNALPVYTYAGMDACASFRTGLERGWYFRSEERSITPTVVYTENDKDKYISLTVDGEEQEVYLLGGEEQTLKIEPGSVRWKEVYKAEVARDSFGYRNLSDTSNRVKWEQQQRFGFGKYTRKKVGLAQSIYLKALVESDVAQSILIEVSNPEALCVVLNGRILRRQTTFGVQAQDREIIRLPLRKGDNQLVIQFYNRYGEYLEYGLNPDIPQCLYRLKLPSMTLYPTVLHNCVVRLARQENRNTPLGLQDLTIEL